MIKTLIADKDGVRLDVFAAAGTGLTRSRIKSLIEDGAVTLRGKAVKAGAPLSAGDVVSVDIPDVPQESDLLPEDIPIGIVYEDDDFAVIDKPQGLIVHPANGSYTGTLVNALLFRLKTLSGINGTIRPGIVHRLDKMTGGLMAVAKNDAAHRSLSRQIAAKEAERIYIGLTEGVIADDAGVIDNPLARDPKDRKKIAVNCNGRRAITRFRVLRRYARHTLVEFTLETGRTHQIRVHCKSINHPIAGDRVYGFKKQRFNVPGQLLYAVRLSLDHPQTGERMTFTAPLPDYFQNILEKIQ
jgi:23S rRNA pseudouridine1911/1915/1917 synthase